MWGQSKKPKRNPQFDSLIGQNTEIRGDVVFTGGLIVQGVVKGNVIAEEGDDSVLTLTERGTIEGEVRVPNIMVNGTVIGDVIRTRRPVTPLTLRGNPSCRHRRCRRRS